MVLDGIHRDSYFPGIFRLHLHHFQLVHEFLASTFAHVHLPAHHLRLSSVSASLRDRPGRDSAHPHRIVRLRIRFLRKGGRGLRG